MARKRGLGLRYVNRTSLSRTRLAVVVLAAVILAGCGGGKHRSAPASRASSSSPVASPSSVATPEPAVNPLTGGKPTTHAVVAVKIDDTAAGQPQLGIDRADIVYVEEAEGGLTRLLAIFNTTLPRVEAVRSTRPSDPELALQYGHIDYVASGGAPSELAPMDRSPLRTAINDRGAPGFTRDPNRPAPYNLIADLSAIAAYLHGPKAKDIGLVWSARLRYQGTQPGTAVNTVVGGTPVSFTWDAHAHRYIRVIGGVRQRAVDGRLIATPNVVVQFCRVTAYPQDIDTAGNPAMYTHTLGSGRLVVFRDGRRIAGSWRRGTLDGGTHLLDRRGRTIALSPGGAWFILVATGAPLS